MIRLANVIAVRVMLAGETADNIWVVRNGRVAAVRATISQCSAPNSMSLSVPCGTLSLHSSPALVAREPGGDVESGNGYSFYRPPKV